MAKIKCLGCKSEVKQYKHIASYGSTIFNVCHNCGEIRGTTTSGEITKLLTIDKNFFHYMIKTKFLASV